MRLSIATLFELLIVLLLLWRAIRCRRVLARSIRDESVAVEESRRELHRGLRSLSTNFGSDLRETIAGGLTQPFKQLFREFGGFHDFPCVDRGNEKVRGRGLSAPYVNNREDG